MCERRLSYRPAGSARPGLGAVVFALALVAGGATAGAQSPAEAPRRAPAFLTAGPSIIRIADGAEIDVAIPTFDPSGAARPLPWRPIFRLEDNERAGGWRLGQVVCDATRSALCLIEKRKGETVQWRVLDLAGGAPLTPWIVGTPGLVMDFDGVNRRVMLGLDEAGPAARIELRSLVATSRSALAVWTRREGEEHGSGRFLPPTEDGRPVLLMTGGQGIRWRILDAAGAAGEPVEAPGALAAILRDTLVVTSQSEDRARSWIGSIAAPTNGGAWPQSAVILAGGSGDAPPLAFENRTWRLWRPAQPVAFTASGALWALTRSGETLGLSEVCRPADRPQHIIARPADAPGLDLSGGVEAELHGGAPGSGVALLSVRTVLGQNDLRALVDVGGAGPGPSPAPCGASLHVVDLARPTVRADLAGVRAETATVTSDDGQEIDYTIISHPDRRGRIMVRPYGAYGLAPERYLAHPFERDWVAAGNSLVVPRLRGDQGSDAWVLAGRGDHKRRTVDDLLAVIGDLHRRDPGLGRVDLVGISAGGYVAAKAALERPDLFGRVLLISAGLDQGIDGRPAQAEEFGPAEGGFAAWFGDRPASGEGQPVFVVLHGEADQVTHPAGVTAFAAYARRLGYVVRGQSYEGVGHDLSDRSDLMSDIDQLSRPPAGGPQ